MIRLNSCNGRERSIPARTSLLFAQCRAHFRRAALLAFATAVLFLLPSLNRAQSVQYTHDKPDQTLRSSMRVDPSTLGLSIEVPIASYPGRGGASVPISLSYSSKQWRADYYDSWLSNGGNLRTESYLRFSEWARAGWTTSADVPTIEWTGHGQLFNSNGNVPCDSCAGSGSYYVNRLHVHMPGGSSHELRINDTPTTTLTYAGTYYAVDGSNLRYEASSISDGVLYLPNGSRYVLGNNICQYVDRNGNTLNYYVSSRQWIDTQGRVLDMPLPASPSATTYTYNLPSTTGTPLTYRLRWSTLENARTDPNDPLRYITNMTFFITESFTPRTPALFIGDYENRLYDLNGAGLFNPMVLAEIILPNGQHYLFSYNVWGELTKVTYPTGAYERFDYAAIPGVSFLKPHNAQANRGVIDRWLSPTGNSTDEVHWHYVASAGSSVLTTKTTAPNNTVTERTMRAETDEVFYAYGFSDPKLGMLIEERVCAPNCKTGTLLKRTLTEWESSGPLLDGWPTAGRNPRIKKQVNVVADTGTGSALTSTTTMDYDADLNVTATNQYHFNTITQSEARTLPIGSILPGVLLRTTETTYLVNDPAYSSAKRDEYRNRNLLSLPTSARVRIGIDKFAETITRYDNDDGNGGEGPHPLLTYPGTIDNWSATGNIRGLPTTHRIWLKLNETQSYLETHTQYDQFGNVRNTWDAKGNLSQTIYSSNYSYAYPTTSITAVPDPSGVYGSPTALTTNAEYNANTGLMTLLMNPNNQTTSYTYDAINRLQTVTRPSGGGSTSYFYSDTPGNLFVRALTSIDATRVTETYQYFDKLGRANRSFVHVGSGNYITSDTQFDSVGRVWRVSNPYQSTGSGSAINPSELWTSNSYDYLSRVISVTTPDGAQALTSYGAITSGTTLGTTVTATDQVGKKRRTVSDAAGRLIRVDEPGVNNNLDDGGVPVQPTNYTYDVLDNLITIIQGSQTRYFKYDSLKRLVRARNPEQAVVNTNLDMTDTPTGNSQWSIGYEYDLNGNLTKKTDARNVIADYAYDSLNRNTTVNYSDSTPDIFRKYDSASNGKGRLAQIWQSGATTSATYIDSYDSMGRPLVQRQKFETNGVDYRTTRTYNLAGSVTSQTYPSDRTVTYTYDDAGRTAGFSGTLGDSLTRTYATGITYSPWGGLSREQFGTDIPLYHKQRYTNRGQLWNMAMSTVTDEENWNRGAIVNYYSLTNYVGGGTGTDTNGNVYVQQHWIPHNDQMSPSTMHQQNYAYDSLNRLFWVGEYLNGGTHTGGQAFLYDRWGNRRIDPVSWGTGINEKQFDVDPATNRLEVPDSQSGEMSYDFAGNLTTDSYSGNGNRTYDAENRMTSAQGINQGAWQYYTYNADGQRVRRKVNGEEIWQVYGMDGELLAEYAANATATNPQKEYGYRNGQLLVTAECPSGPQPLLADDFNDNVRDPAKWNLYASGPNPSPTYEQNGHLEIQSQYSATDSNYGGYVTAATHNLNGKQTSVEVVAPTTNNGGGGNYAGLSWGDSPYKIMLAYNYIYYDNSGFYFDPVRDRYIRLRDDPTTQTVYYESSTNGVTWETRASRWRGGASLDYTVRLYNGNTAGWTSVDLVKFDNFRLEVSEPQPLLADDFNDNVRDPAKWNLYASGPNPSPTYEQNGHLEIQSQYSATDSNYGGYVTAATHNLNGKQTSVEVVAPTTNNGGGGNYAGLSWGDSPYKIMLAYNYIYYDNSGFYFDPVRDRYIRLRDDPTTQTVYYESSTNGVTGRLAHLAGVAGPVWTTRCGSITATPQVGHLLIW